MRFSRKPHGKHCGSCGRCWGTSPAFYHGNTTGCILTNPFVWLARGGCKMLWLQWLSYINKERAGKLQWLIVNTQQCVLIKPCLLRKSSGKLHLNLCWRLVSVPLLFHTLDRLSFTCAAQCKVVNICSHANDFCATVPHHFAVIVSVIETEAY